MKRLIVTPFEWGTQSGYDFLNNDNPDADIENECHVSWSTMATVFERSYRIWEPGRMALSSLGVTDPGPDQPFNVPQIPQGATIHGIKGHLLIMPQRAAVFYNGSTGEPLAVQPDYDDIFAPQGFTGPFVPPYTNEYLDPQQFSRCPFYITMYKGTFNSLGNAYTEGGNIDSGPSDDPDTLTGIDVSNPIALEQERIVWWDMELCTAAHRSRVIRLEGTAFTQSPEVYRTHVTKYNLSLDRNWRVSDDQVLWLHIVPGIVCTPLFVQDGGTAVQLMYKPGFNAELVASMMATPWTPGK